MSNYEIYQFVLCAIVFVTFTALFSAMLILLMKMSIRLIRSGQEDEKIKIEYKKSLKKKKAGIFEKIVSRIFCAFLCLFCAFSVVVNVIGDNFNLGIPTISVVKSGSMATKNEKNKYLSEQNLNDQLQTFDLIFTDKLPAENELKLYDIVVYEVDDTLVVHRIVNIEEKNDKHPNERYFLLQGDALENPDRFPVRYSQMKGIYNGTRIPFIGSLVTFLQSPAGYLCIILIFFVLIAVPLMEKKLEKTKKERLAWLGVGKQTGHDLESLNVAYANFSDAGKVRILPPQWGSPIYIYPVYKKSVDLSKEETSVGGKNENAF